MKRLWFKEAQKNRNDEFYTTKEHVELIFEKYLINYDFRDKVIYCPTDGDNSEFIKYLKLNKLKLNYKELIYTWDDYNTHLDLFQKADIIITNPPFSKLVNEFLPILNKYKKDFFIIGQKASLFSYYKINKDWIYLDILNGKVENNFIDINGDIKGVSIIYITNIKGCPIYNKLVLSNDKEISNVFHLISGRRNYDRLKNIPLTEKAEILVPITVLLEKNRYLFNVYYVEDTDERNGTKMSDGKQRYIRLIAKFKD